MTALDAPAPVLLGTAPPSPSGALAAGEEPALPLPPGPSDPRLLQTLRSSVRLAHFASANRRRFGDVFLLRALALGDIAITSHPDHVRALFTAPSELVPSLTGESQLRPIVGSDSVLTALGERHMRQRKLLLPAFHGKAIQRYSTMIESVIDREIERWPVGRRFALAPRMQSVTLDVILAGIFGIDDRPPAGGAEDRLRRAISWLIGVSTLPGAKLVELMNLGSERPVGLLRAAMARIDRAIYPVIAARRGDPRLEQRDDIMSMLLRAETEDGQRLTDSELRNELLTLLLAGHETTANQLAWTWERLLRTPDAHARLLAAVRGDDQAVAGEVVEQTIWEGMRNRPVVPAIGRRVTVRWRLGDYAIPAGTAVGVNIVLVHHREDLYPDPYAFRPERWAGTTKPGTYTWIPFGGGVRRCLGQSLALAEQRIVLRAMASRLDLEAPDPAPERFVHRNVTMIPRHGTQVVIGARR